MSIVQDSHDIHCNCNSAYAHILDIIFPEGHCDRNKPINQIIQRDLQQCHSTGGEEESHGLDVGDSAATIHIKEESQKEDTEREDIDELLAAVADAEAR